MNRFEPKQNDVVWMKETGKNPVNNLTFLISQLTQAFKPFLQKALSDSTNSTAEAWFGDGVECHFLEAQAGGGWKKGKIRLRLEILRDEPEPEPEPELKDPDSSFLDSLRTDISSQQ